MAADNTHATGYSNYPTISGNGRYVAFVSYATNLVFGPNGNHEQVLIKDRQTGIIELVSSSATGTPANNGGSQGVAISADGRFVAFSSLPRISCRTTSTAPTTSS